MHAILRALLILLVYGRPPAQSKVELPPFMVNNRIFNGAFSILIWHTPSLRALQLFLSCLVQVRAAAMHLSPMYVLL